MADSKQAPVPAPAGAAATAAAPAKKGLPKKLILIVAAVLLLAGGGAAAYLLLGKKADPAATGETKKKEEVHKLPNFIDLEPFTVNLAEKEQDRYMQIKFSLEAAPGEAENTIKEMTPALRSEILLVLGSRTAADLGTREGKEALAKDIVAAANKSLEHTPAERSVTAVRITQLIIQ
jgi:flagellar FliL protein